MTPTFRGYRLCEQQPHRALACQRATPAGTAPVRWRAAGPLTKLDRASAPAAGAISPAGHPALQVAEALRVWANRCSPATRPVAPAARPDECDSGATVVRSRRRRTAGTSSAPPARLRTRGWSPRTHRSSRSPACRRCSARTRRAGCTSIIACSVEHLQPGASSEQGEALRSRVARRALGGPGRPGRTGSGSAGAGWVAWRRSARRPPRLTEAHARPIATAGRVQHGGVVRRQAAANPAARALVGAEQRVAGQVGPGRRRAGRDRCRSLLAIHLPPLNTSSPSGT